MLSIADSISRVRQEIVKAAAYSGSSGNDISILAAVKFQPDDRVFEAVAGGIDAIGENRVQEMTARRDFGVPVHFIGHLQRNKVKQVVGRAALIHSVDSLRLANDISECALSKGIRQDILIEVNIAGEDSKSGFLPDLVRPNLEKILSLKGVRLLGIMCMPPILEDMDNTGNERYFLQARQILVDISQQIIDNIEERPSALGFPILSMGTSQDYLQAVRCGSNMVRLGLTIFGQRKQIT